MRTVCRFADAVPDQPMDLQSVPDGIAKSAAIAASYDEGFTGCFLDTHVDEHGNIEQDYTPEGNAARWYRGDFRSIMGKNSYLFEHVFDSLGTLNDTETGYIASIDAFTAWNRDRDKTLEDWLFQFQQNSGNCVGASGTEMIQGLLGTRAMDPANSEIMKYLAAMWAYMFRGHCGGGWYMGAHASVTVKYGYAFSHNYYNLPNLGSNFDYDGEQKSENYCSSTWCRRQPDDFIAYVKDQQWFFDSGAITEFSGGVDALRRVIQNKGQIHHGSNTTSSSSTPDRTKGIGGHAQIMFGGDWSDKTVAFFKDQGINFNTTDNFPCVNHQTWGSGWNGEVADRYWPSWWGPKPEGAWVMGAKNQMKYFTDGYVYLPNLKGTPGTTPPPSNESKIDGIIEGEVLANGRVRINGTLTAENVEHTPVWISESPNELKYKFVPKI